MNALDLSALEKVRTRGNRTIARCPACAEAGRDEKGDHLSIDEAGRFACVLHPGPEGAEHRKRIFALVGLQTETKATTTKANGKGWPTVKAAGSALAAKEGGTVGGSWKYQDANGSDVLAVVRVNLADGKTFRPYKRTVNGWSMGDPSGPLPLYGLRELQANKSAPVYCVEGEKCADAARSLGLTATTSAHGAKAAHKTDWLPLAGRDVVLLPDNDADGKAYADKVRDTLAKLNPPASVRVVELPGLDDGGDVADYVENRVNDGSALEEIRSDVERLAGEAKAIQPPPPFHVVTASDLADMELPAPIWFVPGLLPQGATLLCGKPKCGKSWMALSLGCAVASGGAFLSKYRCARHEVLYLALEDTRRRLKDRLARMLHNERPPSGLHLVTDCPRMPDGLPALEAFLDSKPLVRLLILDTLQKFRPPSGFKQVYEGDYDAITPLKQLVDRRGLALLIVHHVRKASADDVFETVSGSHGLTGAVDATLILKRNPGEFDGKLHGTGRDLEDVELPVRFNQDGNWSAVEGNATLPPARADLVEAIRQAGRALTAHELAERVGKSLDATKKLLTAAREAGTIIKNPDGLGYALPIYFTYPTSPYKSNPPTPLYSPIGGEQGSMGEQGICTPSVEVEL